MARAGARQGIDSEDLYAEAMAGFTAGREQSELLETVSIKHLRNALLVLNTLSPLLKPAILDACGHCVVADGRIKTTEYELIRLVADQLDCPMPPLAA